MSKDLIIKSYVINKAAYPATFLDYRAKSHCNEPFKFEIVILTIMLSRLHRRSMKSSNGRQVYW